jgi:hypothetical protein
MNTLGYEARGIGLAVASIFVIARLAYRSIKRRRSDAASHVDRVRARAPSEQSNPFGDTS